MPRYLRPNGHVDLAATTIALAEHFRQHGRGRANLITAQDIAELFDITPSQAGRCARDARVLLRAEDTVLAARPGPGGGWYIADEEEQARDWSIRRAADTLTRIENQARDARAAINGVVQDSPRTLPFWQRTFAQLGSVEAELNRVRLQLQVGAAEASELETG